MRVLVTGASGQLGSYVLRALRQHGVHATAWSGSKTGRWFDFDLERVDLADAAAVGAAFQRAQPTAVIHAGALATVAECQRSPEQARRVNVAGTAVLAEQVARAGARLLLVSSDLVFDGARGDYREDDAPAPLSEYGRSKAAAEKVVAPVPGSVIARLSILFGPTLIGRPAFFDQQLAALRGSGSVALFADEWRTPLSLATAARTLLALLESDVTGVVHIGGPERLSRLEMGQRLAAFVGADARVFRAALRAEFPAPEPRPRDTSLDCSLWRARFPDLPWPALEEAFQELFGGVSAE